MSALQPILSTLVAGATLDEARAEEAFEIVLSGRADDGQIGALLTALAARTPTVDELVGAARVLRRHAVSVRRPDSGRFSGATLLDTCGTGGAPKLFNISTIGAIIIAAAGGGRVMVCKHGNFSRTGRGSAELLRELGVKIDAPPGAQAWSLREIGLCFSLAPAHHPSARQAAAVRRSLGFPTIFNLLGPLANPGGAERQVMGTWSHDHARLLANALARLGTRRSLVFSSRDGLDELTTTATNIAHEVGPGGITPVKIDAPTLALPGATIDDLRVASLEEAVRTARAVLDGRSGPCRDVCLLNAAAGLWIADVAGSLSEGVLLAAAAVDSGDARATLSRMAELSHNPG